MTQESIKPIVREITKGDVPKIIALQKESFPHMSREGVVWEEKHLSEHLEIFPQGQFCIEYDKKIVASCSSLVIKLEPEYKEHTWLEACGDNFFSNHDMDGDSLYGADVSTHPKYRRLGLATKLYGARKALAINLNLRRIIAGGRLYNYCEYAKKYTPEEYVKMVIERKISEPVLCFQLKNGFKFIKILPNYLRDSRSLNYATFIEWKNPQFRHMWH